MPASGLPSADEAQSVRDIAGAFFSRRRFGVEDNEERMCCRWQHLAISWDNAAIAQFDFKRLVTHVENLIAVSDRLKLAFD